jgi:DNA-binding SARP family transcriptional activator/predicted ATPase
MSLLTLTLLSAFQLIDGEIQVIFEQARLSELIAYIALHRHQPMSRQSLAFLLWPDSSEGQARTNLRNLLFKLRSAWPRSEEFLTVSRTEISWKDEHPFSIDVIEFENALAASAKVTNPKQREANLRQALVLYKGDLLPDLYEDWALKERERLRGLFLQAVEALVLLLEDQRRYDEAIAEAQRLLQADPLQETSHRHLMRLLAANGDRAAALRAYHACASILEHELDVHPGAATQEIYNRLLNLETVKPLVQSPLAQTTPLVGRLPEWMQLITAWQEARQGKARFVVISGEAGIGKTRLAEELIDLVAHQGYTMASSRAYAAEGALSYAPVSEWLRRKAIRRCVEQVEPIWQVEIARLLPELLHERPDLPTPGPLREGWQRQRFFEGLARLFLAAPQPTLLHMDDLQWCDEETLTFLHYLLRSARQAQVLIVGTTRSEEVDAGHPLSRLLATLRQEDLLGEIELGPLSAAETAALATQTSGEAMPDGMQAHLYQESEGHPLFLIEMIRMRDTDRQTLTADSGPQTASPPSSLPGRSASSLPPKIQAVIGARLGQLSSPARELAQLAAVVGREFNFPLLQAASSADEESLVIALDELWQRRIVREQAEGYDFSHDRIREAAYAALSHIRRRLLHRQVADALTVVYQGRTDEICGLLALHCEEAGLLEKAIGYYQQAADMALHLYAHQDAIHLLNKGLEVLKSLPETAERDRQELALLLMLGSALAVTRGYAAAEVEPVYNRARTLAQRLEDATQHFSALWGLRLFYANLGRSRLAAELGRQLLDLARAARDEELELHACTGLGATLLHAGEFVLSRDLLEQGIALYNPHRHRPQYFNYAIDPAINCIAMLIPALWMLGHPEQALARTRQIMALIDELADPVSSALALNYLCLYHWMRGDVQSNLACAERSLTLCNRHGFIQLLGGALLCKGIALVGLARIDEGISLLDQGLEMWAATGARNLMPFLMFMLASACAKAGQDERALSLLEDALAEMVERGERRAESELLRLKASLLQRRGVAPAQLEAIYQQALTIARIQQGKLLELRAAVDLSRLWQEQGRREEARQLLADIYSWFTEGFDTPDLQEARTLLKALS